MPQVLDPPTTDDEEQILCSYVNKTKQIQIAKIANLANWYFERVVFPGQLLLFEAPPEAKLEIHTSSTISAILSERIPCQSLRMNSKV